MDGKEFVMKQIIINLTKVDDQTSITLNCTKSDDTKIIKVIQPSAITEVDEAFVEKLKQLITDSYGN
jgi:uncharacterized protein YlbG (UPF0298 family)